MSPTALGEGGLVFLVPGIGKESPLSSDPDVPFPTPSTESSSTDVRYWYWRHPSWGSEVETPGSGGGFSINDTGDGGFVISGGSINDTGDGGFVLTGSTINDNGDGGFTIS